MPTMKSRPKTKDDLNYRRGGTALHCGGCDHFDPDFQVMGLDGKPRYKDSRCPKIGMENSRRYRVDYNAICDAFDNSEKLRRYQERFSR